MQCDTPKISRVVVTGMGIVSPIGNNVTTFWDSLAKGLSGVQEITRFDTTNFKCKVAAEVKNFDATGILEQAELKRNDLYASYAVVAAHEAVKQSAIEGKIDPARLGVYVGSGIGGIGTMISQQNILRDRGPSRVSPYLVPMMIANIAAGIIAIRYNAQGVNLPIVTACATSANSVGEAYRAIKLGVADAIICGGAEAPINELAVAGFTSCMALSLNPDPNTACRPFDKNRDGFVIGEGAAVLVLESYQHAQDRGAQILAEVVGYANTCDAYHITAPNPQAVSSTRAIVQSIKEANIDSSSKVYVNAHGTSTQLNDKSETLAIKQAFGKQAGNLAISSTKSMHGHMLGATGAAESIVCVKALQESLLPPTINLTQSDPECDLDYIPNQARRQNIDFAVSNSLGFGGHNAVLTFKKI